MLQIHWLRYSVWLLAGGICTLLNCHAALSQEFKHQTYTALGATALDVSTLAAVETDPKHDPPDRLRASPYWGAVLPVQKIELSAKHDGVIQKILVEPGDTLSSGQIAIQLHEEELSARRALAEQELFKAEAIMNDDSAVKAAQTQLAKAQATYDTVKHLQHKSELEVFRLRMDVQDKQAMLAAATARQAQDRLESAIKREQLKLADLQLQAAEIASPVEAMVAEQLKSTGEMARPGEPILTLIRMDVVYFRVELDMRYVPPHQIVNFAAEAVFDLGGDEELRIPHLRFSQIIPQNLDNQHYYALAKIQNTQIRDAAGQTHWRIRPGMSGQVVFTSLEAPVAAELASQP